MKDRRNSEIIQKIPNQIYNNMIQLHNQDHRETISEAFHGDPMSQYFLALHLLNQKCFLESKYWFQKSQHSKSYKWIKKIEEMEI